MDDYVTQLLQGAHSAPVSGAGNMDESTIQGLVNVGELTEVGAAHLRKAKAAHPSLPSPQFERSARDTERRAAAGFIEDGTGAAFATMAAGATSIMRSKVSRAAHLNRLLIVPSGPGIVLRSIKIGDEEQLLASGAPVELYSVSALTDTLPDNFSPLGPALDCVIEMVNTTAGALTATLGYKAQCKR